MAKTTKTPKISLWEEIATEDSQKTREMDLDFDRQDTIANFYDVARSNRRAYNKASKDIRAQYKKLGDCDPNAVINLMLKQERYDQDFKRLIISFKLYFNKDLTLDRD